jgi:putative intracellular protease/amidase
MWDFPMDEDLQRVQRECYEAGNVLGAVCHGPICLVNVTLSNGESLIKGKGCAGFCEEEEAMAGLKELLPVREGGQSPEEILLARGATYTKGAPWSSHCVVDGRIVTGQNPQSAAAVGVEVVKLVSAL